LGMSIRSGSTAVARRCMEVGADIPHCCTCKQILYLTTQQIIHLNDETY
jgi:hypothetical protein